MSRHSCAVFAISSGVHHPKCISHWSNKVAIQTFRPKSHLSWIFSKKTKQKLHFRVHVCFVVIWREIFAFLVTWQNLEIPEFSVFLTSGYCKRIFFLIFEQDLWRSRLNAIKIWKSKEHKRRKCLKSKSQWKEKFVKGGWWSAVSDNWVFWQPPTSWDQMWFTSDLLYILQFPPPKQQCGCPTLNDWLILFNGASQKLQKSNQLWMNLTQAMCRSSGTRSGYFPIPHYNPPPVVMRCLASLKQVFLVIICSWFVRVRTANNKYRKMKSLIAIAVL